MFHYSINLYPIKTKMVSIVTKVSQVNKYQLACL